MNTRTFSWLLAASCAAVLSIAGTAAATPYSIDTSVGVGADTRVRGGTYAGNNYGSATDLPVKYNTNVSYRRKGYFRFDLSSFVGQILSDATLTLDVSLNNGGSLSPDPQSFTVNVFGLTDGHAGEGWGEGTITYNNAPANDTGGHHITGEAAFLGQFAVPALANPTVTFSDPNLAAFLNADTDDQATLILTRDSSPGAHNLVFAPKENGSFTAPTISGQSVPGVTMSLTTGDGVGADAYVRLGTPTTNYGSATDVLTKNNGSGSTTRKSYLRFDLSSLPQTALEAWLSFDTFVNNEGGGGTTPQEQVVNVYGLDDGDAGESWGESTITWNNAPANNTSNNGILGNASLLGQFTVSAADVPGRTMFSNQNLVDFVNADTDGRATIILTRVSSNGSWNLGFASDEHATFLSPTLSIAIPEPSALLLAAMGLLGLLAWGRRRRR